MRLRIIKISAHQTGGILIEFETKFGAGRAVWMSSSPPQIGAEFEVEIEIPNCLVWNQDIYVIDQPSYLIGEKEGKLVLQGVAESIEPDGCVLLRIGDSVVMLDTIGEPAPIGSAIRVLATNVGVYDNNQ